MIDRDDSDPESYPKANVQALYDAGIVVAPFPAALGGADWRLEDSVSAIEAIAAASPSTALIVSMPLGLAGVYGLGPDIAPPAHRAAWSAQTEQVALEYRQCLIYAACNSEKGAGGALEATQTVATRGEDGRLRLTGEKILASSGRYASTFFSTAKVSQEDLPGAGVVEFFFVQLGSPGVEILQDWDGFGMRATESHTVRYAQAPVRGVMGFPDFLKTPQPLLYLFCVFAATPLGCARDVDLARLPRASLASFARALVRCNHAVRSDAGLSARDSCRLPSGRRAAVRGARAAREDLRHAGSGEAVCGVVRARRRPELSPHQPRGAHARGFLRRGGVAAAAHARARQPRGKLHARQCRRAGRAGNETAPRAAKVECAGGQSCARQRG